MFNNFLGHLFGSIAQGGMPFPTGAGFIPYNSSGGTIDIKGQDAVWLGLKNPLMQKYAYEYCYPVSSVADRLAEMDTVGKVGIFRKGGKGKGGLAAGSVANQLNKLFTQPNPFQSWEQFRGQQVMYKLIFGFCPVLPVVPAGFGPEMTTQLINLPPWLFSVRLKQQKSLINKREDLVDKWLVTILGSAVELNPEDVIILEGSLMMNYDTAGGILPQSKLVGLDMAVSNICAAMEADNVVLKKRGPLGFISHDAAATKDAVAGYIPMQEDEKNELQESLSRYGLSLAHYQYVISRTAVKWNPTGANVKDLGTTETLTKCEKAVCHRFNYPYALYEQTETTFANGDNAAASVYQDNVIPNAQKDYNKYSKFLRTEENNIEIQVDYSHVGALQEDVLMAAEASEVLGRALDLDYKNGLITLNQYREKKGYDTTEDGGTYYTAPAPIVPKENDTEEDPTV